MSFHELKKDKEKILPLFPSIDHHVTIEAVVEGTCNGKIFVDNVETPQTAAVWTAPAREALLYIGGSHDNDAFNEHLLTYFNEVITPESIKKGLDFYEIYPTRNWEPVLQPIFRESMFKEIDSYYILNPVKFRELQPNWRDTIPAGFSLNRVESESVFEEAQNVPVFSELDSWKSFDTFQKYGFGYYLVEKSAHKIVSGCLTKVVAVKSRRCEIAIGTDIHYQRRGFATLVASAAVDEALKRGLDVIWECNHGNTASINTNQKIGFEYICDENLYFSHLYESLEICLYYGYYYLDELNDPVKAVEWFQKGIAKSAEEFKSISAGYNFHAARAFAVTGKYDAAIQRLYAALDRVQDPENFLNRLKSEKSFDNLRDLEDYKKIQHTLEEMVKKGT